VSETQTISIDLPSDIDAEIRRRLATGHYATRGDVVRAALQALDRQEAEQAQQSAALEAAIERGLADADAGRVHPVDRVRAEMRARFSHRRG